MNGIHEGKKCGLVDHPACFMGKFRRETGLASKHYQQTKPSLRDRRVDAVFLDAAKAFI